jgi:uncharacterized membrane protein
MMAEPGSSIPRTAFERVLQLTGIAVLMTLMGYAVAVWGQMPERVPVHFGASGLPDAWGPRSSLLVLPVLGVTLFAALTVLERFPRLSKYGAAMPPENARALQRLGRQLVATVKVTTTAVLAYIFWGSTRVALGEMRGLHAWFFPATFLALGATLVFFVPRMVRLKSGVRQ